MTVQFKKHVRIICDLEVGEVVTTKGFGYHLDGRDLKIEDIKASIGHCESGFIIKVNGYDGYIDSNWVDKK